MTEDRTAQDIANGMNALAGGVKEAGRKRNEELVAKQGYVAFRNPNAVAQFHADPFYANWNYTYVDGEYRFFPPQKKQDLTQATQVNQEQQIELYNSHDMPLSNDPERRAAQEKMLRGEPLTMKEKINYAGGHDKPLRKLGDYECKPDHCYRAISLETYELYKKEGFITGFSEYLGEVKDADGQVRIDNGGVDWYLGGAGKRYGDIIIECPADKRYFQPNYDNGFGLSGDLEVRHMKSSGKQNPIPFSMITNIFDLRQIKTQEKETQQEQQQIEQDPQILETYKQTISNSTQNTFVAITTLQDDPSKCKYTLSTMDKRTGERKIVQEVIVDFDGRFSMETIPSLYNQLCDGIPAIDYENERRISFQNMDNSKMMGFGNLTPEQKQLIQNMKQFVDNQNINMQPTQSSEMHR